MTPSRVMVLVVVLGDWTGWIDEWNGFAHQRQVTVAGWLWQHAGKSSKVRGELHALGAVAAAVTALRQMDAHEKPTVVGLLRTLSEVRLVCA